MASQQAILNPATMIEEFKKNGVMIVGYRGWTRHGVTPDSAARFTEPYMDAWGLKYYLVERDEDADRISIAFEEAYENNTPIVVLIGDEYHGFNR